MEVVILSALSLLLFVHDLKFFAVLCALATFWKTILIVLEVAID